MPQGDLEAFGRWAADEIAVAIENEGADTVAAVFLEPVQNSGGCFPPPPGYFERVREICDEYDVLLVSDEVICAFGRLGHWFGAERYGYQPDIITCAKGITSGYAPLGAMIASDRLMAPFLKGHESFLHGYTFGGHPVSCAVAMANLDVFENEKVLEHVRDNEGAFRSTLEQLKDLPIVGDVRGDGYFYGIELVKDKATKETFDDDESERLLRGFLSKALYDAGLYCRADDRGDPVIQLVPAADLRPDALRRDRADPARRPRQGRHAPLTHAPRFVGGLTGSCPLRTADEPAYASGPGRGHRRGQRDRDRFPQGPGAGPVAGLAAQHDRDRDHEHQGADHVDLHRHAALRDAPDVEGERRRGARVEVGDDEVVEGQRERQQRGAEDAGEHQAGR